MSTGAAPGGASGDQIGLERLVLFSDAVFAIVITLLVLPLTAEVELPTDSAEAAAAVADLWPRIVTFVIGFLVVGQFWIAHHGTFGLLRSYDRGLLWLNLVGLLTVAFMPFPTAVLGAAELDDRFPAMFYAASMAVASAVLTLTWLYALRRGLVDPAAGPAVRHAHTVRGVATASILALSVAVAAIGLWAAMLCWLLVIPATRVLLTRRQQRVASTG